MATLRPSRWFTYSSGWRSCLRKSNPGRNGVAAFGCGRRLRYELHRIREDSMGMFKRRTGGRVLVDQLITQGVDRLTCVPGESYLAVLDALHGAEVDVILCRNEGGAAMMA